MKKAIKIYFNHVGGSDIINAVLDNKSRNNKF